ncbi:isochorismatase family cysteine hydrolase [Janibacter melonis]|uniref:cysteine hydrolase family protein n=1 Tax=Janibacter melonis TaxID=262209 RepID=UPI0017873C56|nr:cysteine hydrolase [Janibacter melonis]
MPQDRAALVVVDMQNSYFEDPVLEEQREWLLPRVNDLVAAARDAGADVVLVRTEHARDRSTWTLSMRRDDQGFAFPGTEQAAPLDGLDTEGALEVVKTRDSAFVRTDLEDLLRERGVGRILLCGVSTHSCIAQTATHGFALDLDVAIAREACASENFELAEALLAFLRDEVRQPLLHQDECADWLSGRGTPGSGGPR